jgi:hypothetical protein
MQNSYRPLTTRSGRLGLERCPFAERGGDAAGGVLAGGAAETDPQARDQLTSVD